jgi:transcriptional regulator with XRE-family HTH domain
MSSSQLPNYLLSRRKRLGLSQAEVAYLLGVEGGAKVCRYERFVREPNLRTAFAFEVIFQESASELFAGCYRTVEREVAARARVLARRAANQAPGKSTARKQTILSLIAMASEPKRNHP